MRIYYLLLSISCLFPLVGFGDGLPITIVEDGHSSYQIVIPEKATPQEEYAAEELATYIRELSDAELPVVRDTVKETSTEFVLGIHNSRIAGEFFQAEEWGENGFTLKTTGEKIVVVGGAPRGVIYGVLELLERWGIRFFTEDITRIPKHEQLVMPMLNLTIVPSFPYREVAINNFTNHDLFTHLRLTGPVWGGGHDSERHGKTRTFGGKMGHTFFELCPPKKYLKTHPGYFSLVDGERTGGQLCLTNPDLPKMIAEELKKRMRGNPAKFWHVSQMDNHDYCRCRTCRKLTEAERAQSGPLIHFVNRIADLVKQEFPERVIVTFAYTYNEKPPEHVRTRKNVAVQFCPIGIDRLHAVDEANAPQVNQQNRENLERWSEVATALHIWDYANDFTGCLKIFPDYYIWADNLRFYRELGATFVFMQGAYGINYSEFSALRQYVLAKLLWDVDQPAEGLIEEFCGGVYGEHAEMIMAYMREMHESALKANADKPFTTDRNHDHNKCGLTEDQMLNWLHRFEAATEREDNPVTAKYLRQAMLPLTYEYLRFGQPRLIETPKGLKPDREVTPEYRQKIEQFRDIAKEWKLRDDHLGFLAELEACTRPQDFLFLREGDTTMKILPGMGGVVKELTIPGLGIEIEDCFIGNLGHGWHGEGWCEFYNILQKSENAVTLEASLGRSMALQRTIKLLDERTYFVEQKVTNRFTERQSGEMLMMNYVPCSTRAEEEIWGLGSNGEWKKQEWYGGVWKMLKNQPFVENYGGGGWALVNKHSGLSRIVRWNPTELREVIGFWHKDIRDFPFTVFLYGKREKLDMNQSVSASITVEYCDKKQTREIFK